MGGSHKKVRRHSKIDSLPEDVQAEVERLLVEGEYYEDIAEFLRKKGYDISKSAVGRYGKEFLNQVRELRIVEDQAKTLVSQAGGDGLVLEEAAAKLAAKSIMKLLLDNGVNAARIPYLVSDLAKLQMSSVRREALKADLRKKIDKTFKNVEKDAKKMSKDEMLRFIKEEVYGLV